MAGLREPSGLNTIIEHMLKAPVKITSEGKSRKVSTLEAIFLRLREKALHGDHRAFIVLLACAREIYGGDEGFAASGDLSAEEAKKLLQIYTKRVLSGAVANSEDDDSKRDSDGSTESDSLQTISVKRGLLNR